MTNFITTKPGYVLIVTLITLVIVSIVSAYLSSRPLSPEQLAERRLEAYNYAVKCSKVETPKLSFEEIKWRTVPGPSIILPTLEGTVVYLDGYFEVETNTIWMPEVKKEIYWIMAHEAMHAIGFLDHPDHPFKTCNLLGYQNYQYH